MHEPFSVASRFVAGVIEYLDRIVAITAPSVVSYLRLTPCRRNTVCSHPSNRSTWYAGDLRRALCTG